MLIYSVKFAGSTADTVLCEADAERYGRFYPGAEVRPAPEGAVCAFCESARLTRPPDRPLVLGRPNRQD